MKHCLGTLGSIFFNPTYRKIHKLTLLLLGAGLFGLAGFSRKRGKK